MFTVSRVGLIACITTALAALWAVAVVAQGSTQANAGSLAGVTAELRQLRLAVEESTRSQTQTHALGVYLSAQQARLVQITTRLDTARRELDELSLRSNQLTTELASNEEALRSAAPELRQELEMGARALKQELATVVPQLQQAQTREAELSQLMQAEEVRWTDLLAKLEQLVRK